MMLDIRWRRRGFEEESNDYGDVSSAAASALLVHITACIIRQDLCLCLFDDSCLCLLCVLNVYRVRVDEKMTINEFAFACAVRESVSLGFDHPSSAVCDTQTDKVVIGNEVVCAVVGY